MLLDDPELTIEDVDFSDSHLVLVVREGRNLKLSSVDLPLPCGKVTYYISLHIVFRSDVVQSQFVKIMMVCLEA